MSHENMQGQSNEKEHGKDKKVSISILFDGIPVEKEYSTALKVEVIIKDILPPGEKDNWAAYILTLRNQTAPLDVAKSLEESGLKDGDVLSLTKRDGGGGAL